MTKFALRVLSVAIISGAVSAEELETVHVTGKKVWATQTIPSAESKIENETLLVNTLSGADVSGLSLAVPNLFIEGSNGRYGQRFYIRGLGNTDFDFSASQPVAVYSDGVVQESSVLRSFPLFDVESIEVLRGPQGSIYGRNSTAGAFLINTRNPTESFEGYLTAGAGNMGAHNIELALSGPLTDTITARTSALIQNREHWVDNEYTGESDSLGGFEDSAIRSKLLWKPSEDFSLLAELRGRKLNGTSTLFRANTLSTGSNNLNSNYDRDSVQYDQGNGNHQRYDMWGTTIRAEFQLGDVHLTSTSSYDKVDGISNGDIDGGYGAVYLPEMGPGFIPFQSQTTESSKSDQITQEFVASFDHEGTNYLVGAMYFKSHLSAYTNTYISPVVGVHHTNQAWSVFGNADRQLTDRLSIGIGFNYMDDDKSLYSPSERTHIQDSQLSKSIYLSYDLSTQVSLWGKYASGFRGPSIQGRNIAYGGEASTADSETVDSVEFGITYRDERIEATVNLFGYDLDDYQLTALGGSGNNIELVNAENAEARGVELEVLWGVTDQLSLYMGAAYTHTKISDKNLLVATCGSGACTPKDPEVILPGGTFLNIDGNVFPNAPKETVQLKIMHETAIAEFKVFSELSWQYEGERQIFLYDAEEFTLDPQYEIDVVVGLTSPNEKWTVRAYALNVTDEENIEGAIDFNNLTTFTNEPRTYGVALSVNF